jgi:hypothetical protein
MTWFLRDSTLVAKPFDVNRRTLVPLHPAVAEGVRGAFRAGVFSVSEWGAMVFQAGSSTRLRTRLVRPARAADMANLDLWIVNVARDLRTRFTFDDERPRFGAIWSPDERFILYQRRSGEASAFPGSCHSKAAGSPFRSPRQGASTPCGARMVKRSSTSTDSMTA